MSCRTKPASPVPVDPLSGIYFGQSENDEDSSSDKDVESFHDVETQSEAMCPLSDQLNNLPSIEVAQQDGILAIKSKNEWF